MSRISSRVRCSSPASAAVNSERMSSRRGGSTLVEHCVEVRVDLLRRFLRDALSLLGKRRRSAGPDKTRRVGWRRVRPAPSSF